jgi:murein DD-endopeptidase MepM/ murein hydrolase activator NlpD
VPHRRRRSRGARLILPVALGLVALLTIGSVGTGSIEAPGPISPIEVVAGAVDQAPSETPVGAGQHSAPTRPAPATPIPNIPDARLALTDGPPPLAALSGYRWPLPKGRLTQDFGPTAFASRELNGKPFHDGIDLATFCGDRVVAAHDGTVLAAGRRFDSVMGWVGELKPYTDRLERKHLWQTLPITIVIDDGNGYRSVYAHFSKVAVKKGKAVKAGQLLGYEGATGRASGCHLHYGLFSPLETATFTIEPAVVKRMKVPAAQIARIDPLLVLPQHAEKPKKSASPTPPG